MKKLAHLVAALTAMAIILLPGWVRADVTTVYDVTKCRGVDVFEDQKLIRGSGVLSANDDAEIVCPIVKTTSAPGVSDDKIYSVSIPGGMGSLSCDVSIYEMNPASTSSGNVLERREDDGVGYQYTLVMGTIVSNYWQTSQKWYYAELHCRLGAFSNMMNYSVLEAGTQRTGKRIVSAAACYQSPSASNQTYYRYTAPSTSPWPWAGYIQAIGDEEDFQVNCPNQSGAGRYVQIGLGPNVVTNTPNQMGCRNSGSDTWQYVTSTGSSPEFPPKRLQFTQSSPRSLICAMKNRPSTGDGKVFSYRSNNSSSF